MSGQIFVWLLATVLLATVSALAQQSKKIPRIGSLGTTSPSPISARVGGFRLGLRDLGQNIAIAWAEGKLDLPPQPC